MKGASNLYIAYAKKITLWDFYFEIANFYYSWECVEQDDNKETSKSGGFEPKFLYIWLVFLEYNC